MEKDALSSASYQKIPIKFRSKVAGVEQQITLVAVSSTVLSLPRMSVPRAGASLGIDLFKRKKMVFGIEAIGSYHLPSRNTSTSYSGGFNDYQGRLRLRHDAKAFSLLGAAFYRREKFSSASVNTVRTELGVELGIGFVIGDE